MIQSFRDVVI